MAKKVNYEEFKEGFINLLKASTWKAVQLWGDERNEAISCEDDVWKECESRLEWASDCMKNINKLAANDIELHKFFQEAYEEQFILVDVNGDECVMPYVFDYLFINDMFASNKESEWIIQYRKDVAEWEKQEKAKVFPMRAPMKYHMKDGRVLEVLRTAGSNLFGIDSMYNPEEADISIDGKVGKYDVQYWFGIQDRAGEEGALYITSQETGEVIDLTEYEVESVEYGN